METGSSACADLGFPAGKNKTILIDLDGVFLAGCPPALSAPHEPGGFLGLTGRCRVPAGGSAENPATRAAIGRSAPPRLLLDDTEGRQLARAAALRHARGHEPAVE